MSLILRPPWTRQPNDIVGLDIAGPFAANLQAAVLVGSFGAYEVVSGRSFSRLGSATGTGIDSRQQGRVVTTSTGSTDAWALTGLEPLCAVTDKLSWVVGAYSNTAGILRKRAIRFSHSTAGTIIPIDFSDGVSDVIQTGVQVSGVTFANANLVGQAQVAGRHFFLGYSYDTNNGSTPYLASVDGNTQAFSVNGASVNNLANVINQIYLGNSGSGFPLNGGVSVALLWNCLWSQGALNALTANPWQVLAPIKRRIWVPVAAGGGAISTTAAGLVVPRGADASTKTGTTSFVGQILHLGASSAAKIATASQGGSVRTVAAITGAKVAGSSAAGSAPALGSNVGAKIAAHTSAGIDAALGTASWAKISQPSAAGLLSPFGASAWTKTGTAASAGWAVPAGASAAGKVSANVVTAQAAGFMPGFSSLAYAKVGGGAAAGAYQSVGSAAWTKVGTSQASGATPAWGASTPTKIVGHSAAGQSIHYAAAGARKIADYSLSGRLTLEGIASGGPVAGASISAAAMVKLAEIWARLGLDAARPVLNSSTSITFGTITQSLADDGSSVTCTRVGASLPSGDADAQILDIWRRLGLDSDAPMVTTMTTITAGPTVTLNLEGDQEITVSRQ